MLKKEIATKAAPAALGPYSQGIQAGSFVFISGQLALDPETATLIDGTIGEQTQQIMRNIEAIAKAAGGSLDSIVKTTIFLADMGDFQEVNAAYSEFFSSVPPARATIQVAALTLDARVEIEAVAIVE